MAHRIPELKLQTRGILLIASLSPGGPWALVKSPMIEVPWDHEGRQYLNIFLKTNIIAFRRTFHIKTTPERGFIQQQSCKYLSELCNSHD